MIFVKGTSGIRAAIATVMVLYWFNATVQAQTQYGISVTCGLELSTQPNDHLYLHIGVNAGVGYQISDWSFPTYNFEMDCYNGGLGSRSRSAFFPSCKRKWTADFIHAITFTAGGSTSLVNYPMPLYYFSNFVYPCLQNPFRNSLSLGSNFIFSTRPQNRSQRVGFFNGHIRNFQLSYYNDAGPVMELFPGDGKDRYYTGGLVLVYKLPISGFINTLEAGFHKFTGYTPHSFEISNRADLGFVNYSDSAEQYYNKGYWFVSAGNIEKGYSLSYRNYNDFIRDLQRKIHHDIYNTYHLIPYPKSKSLTIQYYNQQTHKQ